MLGVDTDRNGVRFVEIDQETATGIGETVGVIIGRAVFILRAATEQQEWRECARALHRIDREIETTTIFVGVSGAVVAIRLQSEEIDFRCDVFARGEPDQKRVVQGTSVSVRVHSGGSRSLETAKTTSTTSQCSCNILEKYLIKIA